MINLDTLFFVDFFKDNKYITTFPFGLKSEFDSIASVYKRALSKVDYLYNRFRRENLFGSFCIKLKDKENNLIQLIIVENYSKINGGVF